jgi:AcrR family transcriptional regulator
MTDAEADLSVSDTSAPHRRSCGPRRSDSTHRAILDAAEALLVEKGPSGLTFEAVARRAGAGKPTLYRWWPTRTDLLIEVYDRKKHAALSQPDTGRLDDDLVTLLTDLWRFWREGPAGRAYATIIAEAQDDPVARAGFAARLEDPAFPLTPIFERAVR